MSRLPPEICISIFEFATYTSHVHDPDPLDLNFQLFITKNYQGSLKRSLVFSHSCTSVSRSSIPADQVLPHPSLQSMERTSKPLLV